MNTNKEDLIKRLDKIEKDLKDIALIKDSIVELKIKTRFLEEIARDKNYDKDYIDLKIIDALNQYIKDKDWPFISLQENNQD